MSDRAACIRAFSHLADADPVLVRRYATLATRWEQLRYAIQKGHTTPGDDVRYADVSSALKVLSRDLGLTTVSVATGDAIPGITNAGGFLPGDTCRYWCKTWREAAEIWTKK